MKTLSVQTSCSEAIKTGFCSLQHDETGPLLADAVYWTGACVWFSGSANNEGMMNQNGLEHALRAKVCQASRFGCGDNYLHSFGSVCV